MRKPSAEIEAILGYVDEPELIHRDNLVLLQYAGLAATPGCPPRRSASTPSAAFRMVPRVGQK